LEFGLWQPHARALYLLPKELSAGAPQEFPDFSGMGFFEFVWANDKITKAS
jgi:hypothetical protein